MFLHPASSRSAVALLVIAGAVKQGERRQNIRYNPRDPERLLFVSYRTMLITLRLIFLGPHRHMGNIMRIYGERMNKFPIK